MAFAAVEGIFFSGRYAQVMYTVSASLHMPNCLDLSSIGLHTVFTHAVMICIDPGHYNHLVSVLTKCIAVQFLQHLLAEEAWLHAWPHLLQ